MKTILSTVAVATLIAFSGCSAVTDNPIANAAKSATSAVTDSASSAAGAVTDGAKGAVSGVKGAASDAKGAVSGAADLPTGKSSLKDMAVDKAVGAADAKTDGAASKVIDAVK